MREILFRGKDIHTGEWVYGYLYITHNGEYEVGNYSSKYNIERCTSMVIPESVGQFTGIFDKSGNKIFEGDIVRTQPFYDRPYSSKRKEKQFVGVVEYYTHKFNGNNFHDEQIYDAHWRVRLSEDIGRYTHCSWSDFWNCEIIGNIQDNCELMNN